MSRAPAPCPKGSVLLALVAHERARGFPWNLLEPPKKRQRVEAADNVLERTFSMHHGGLDSRELWKFYQNQMLQDTSLNSGECKDTTQRK